MTQLQPTTCAATSNLSVPLPDNQNRNVVLYFYPRDATPGCTTEGQDFRDNFAEFTDANCVIYGVSKDDLTKHEKFKAKQGFPFELIADTKGVLCEAFGVWQLKKFMGKENMGIVRSTFIISPTGEVLKSWEKVRVAGHVDEVLNFVKSL
jgi:peroxiredoxin Q/BCP